MNSSKIQGQSILTPFDYSSLEDIYPSLCMQLCQLFQRDILENGARLIFDRQVPFQLRIQQDESGLHQQVGTIQSIRVKLLIIDQGRSKASSSSSNMPSPLHTVKLQLMSDSDLFFHYHHTVNQQIFKSLRKQQRLMIDFHQYPNILIKMLNCCINEPHKSLAIFLMAQDGQARLDFIQNIQYKFVELLSCICQVSPMQQIKKQIGFRYGMMKSKFVLLQGKMNDIYSVVKLKNPSLLLQIQKFNLSQPAESGKTQASVNNATMVPRSAMK